MEMSARLACLVDHPVRLGAGGHLHLPREKAARRQAKYVHGMSRGIAVFRCSFPTVVANAGFSQALPTGFCLSPRRNIDELDFRS